ncbi:MAG TPA: L,D-transpeptidase, partial [Acidimicrobiales bacterium]|nr:L,D-transpeptidase [Acidimicrobiales bacterium]
MRRGAMTLGLVVAALAVAGSGSDQERAMEVATPGSTLSDRDGNTAPPTTLPLPPAFPSTTTTPRHRSLVATVKGPSIEVFDSPDGGVPPSKILENPRPSGADQVFLVTGQRAGWLNVMLPVRPNGSSGWVRSDAVSLAGHNYRIVVELGAHKVTVFNGDQVFHEEPVGVGVETTPTPGGHFYTVELFRS